MCEHSAEYGEKRLRANCSSLVAANKGSSSSHHSIRGSYDTMLCCSCVDRSLYTVNVMLEHFLICNHRFGFNLQHSAIYCCSCRDYVDFVDIITAPITNKHKKPRLEGKPLEEMIVPHGIANLGSTCFMNSVLQVLGAAARASSQSFVRWISPSAASTDIVAICSSLSSSTSTSLDFNLGHECLKILESLIQHQDHHHHPSEDHHHHPSEDHHHHVNNHHHQSHDPNNTNPANIIIPANLLYRLWLRYNRFIGDDQHDAHECLLKLIDALSDCLSSSSSSSESSGGGHGLGACVSKMICNACHQLTSNEEIFVDLSVPVPSVDDNEVNGDIPVMSSKSKKFVLEVSLFDCISSYFSSEVVLNVECDACHAKTEKTKSMRLLHAPNVLIVHLKRFTTQEEKISRRVAMYNDYDYSASSMPVATAATSKRRSSSRYRITRQSHCVSKKICTHVIFPLHELDLSCFIDNNEEGRGSIPPSCMYSLCGFVCHSGSGLDHGHYTCYTRAASHLWCLVDDDHVMFKEDVDVLKETDKAYILVYVKS